MTGATDNLAPEEGSEGTADAGAEADPNDGAPETGGPTSGSGVPSEGSEPSAALEALRAEKDRLYQQLLRTAADLDNFRKRTKRDLEEAERRGGDRVLLEILPVIDNLERASAAAQGAADVKAVAEGVAMVLKFFDDVATRIQLERIRAVGERFDPTVHDAVQQLETAEHPAGAIVAEVVPGFRRHGRVLRAAMVVVARPPAAARATPPPPSTVPSEGADDAGEPEG